ncbi:mechanosensitive ion channel family protein [Corynebacterium choanae]|uniref:Putative MscS family protein YkuT n=1 Tax=Corynebacterium choanae TaxID=1862358 RepID=A0A3G6J7W4_9CORY|nr:mechanosensitive ion channel family protein [Corynebacterium choanae]AZA14147.1 putative MscS family protein YkuT [Corynebacterium choanae]
MISAIDSLDASFTDDWVTRGIKIAVIIVLALIAQWIAHLVIHRVARHQISHAKAKRLKVAKAKAPTPQEEAADQVRRESRVNTLSGVTRSAIAIFIWGWAIIGVLSNLGLEVRPLLASAGVVGLAIGFGAKALVQDFITGIFMLLEDQYGVGDWIQIDDKSGTVEDVSLRITTLRDVDGNLWYIRNGQITTVGNSTKGFATARLEVPIGLSNDVEKAKATILAAAQQAADSPEIADFVLDAPEMDGVSAMNVDHLTIRLRMKVIPGQQWFVQRHMLSAVIPALQSAGISTPYPHGIGITAEQSTSGK